MNPLAIIAILAQLITGQARITGQAQLSEGAVGSPPSMATFSGTCTDYGTNGDALRFSNEPLDPFGVPLADIDNGNVCEPYTWFRPDELVDGLPRRESDQPMPARVVQ